MRLHVHLRFAFLYQSETNRAFKDTLNNSIRYLSLDLSSENVNQKSILDFLSSLKSASYLSQYTSFSNSNNSLSTAVTKTYNHYNLNLSKRHNYKLDVTLYNLLLNLYKNPDSENISNEIIEYLKNKP